MAQETWLLDDAKTIDFESIRRLKVGLIAGQIDIVGHDEPTTRVEVRSVSGKPLRVSVDGGTLSIAHSQLSWDNFIDVFRTVRLKARAEVSVMVPRDVALHFGVVSATALIAGLTEDASISTVSGDVTVDRMYGDLDLNAVSGEIAVRDHYGAIDAKTVSGDVTASGEILKLSLKSVSGDAFLDLTGIPDAISINSVSGDVTLRLEPEVPAQYTVTTASGRLQLDSTEITGVRGRYQGKFGELHGRWLEFGVNTVSGDVTVVHAARAAS